MKNERTYELQCNGRGWGYVERESVWDYGIGIDDIMCDDITCDLHLASVAGMDDIKCDDLTYDDLNPETWLR